MANNFPNRVRVAGSGFTIFTFQGQPIAFAQQVSHTSAQPVSAPVAIQPMDEPYPVQVITPAAAGMGSLTLNLLELYESKVWERLGTKVGTVLGSSNDRDVGGQSLNGLIDIVDIFIKIASLPGNVNVVKYIRPPNLGGLTRPPYTEEFHGCVVTNVVDGEEINVGTMEVIKQITVGYTYSTRNGQSSAAFALRDRPFPG